MTAQTSAPTLDASVRDNASKPKKLRRDGQIPAVIYGHNRESLSLATDAAVFTKLYHAAGTTTLVSLSIDKKAPVKVLIHDVQLDPSTHAIKHADFYAVNLKEKLRTEVPLSFVGTAPAVDVLGGSLMTVKDAVEVECLPEDLIHEIEVDISKLATFEDDIRVKDLSVPASVTILDEPEAMIASVNEPRSEAEMEDLEAPVVDTAAEVASETGNEPAAEGSEKSEE